MVARGRGGSWLLLLLSSGVVGCGARSTHVADDDTDSDTDTDDSCTVHDADGDGYDSIVCGGDDCDDLDPAQHPGAEEVVPDWVFEEVGEGLFPSLALDSNGDPHMAYYRFDGLMYAVRAEGTWTIEPVAPEVSLPSLALDSDDVPHILLGTRTAVLQAVRYDIEFELELVARDPTSSSGSRSVGLSFDVDGVPHAVWSNGEAVRHGQRSGGAWTDETIADGFAPAGGSAAIVFDRYSTAHVAFSMHAVHYATNEGGGWHVELLERGSAPALAMDGRGRLHVAFDADRVLRYGVHEGGRWSIETLASSISDYDVAAGPENEPHLIVREHDDGRAEYVHTWRDGPAWRRETLPIDATRNQGLAIEVGESGDLHVALVAPGAEGEDRLFHGSRPAGDRVDQDCDGDDVR